MKKPKALTYYTQDGKPLEREDLRLVIVRGTRCDNVKHDVRCDGMATHWLFGPPRTLTPGGAICEKCGREILDEYLAVLGEQWHLLPGRIYG